MKKYSLFILLTMAALVSCKKESPAQEEMEDNSNISYVKDGLCIVADAALTKVAVVLDTSTEPATSNMSWESGDHIKVYHNGTTYDYVTNSTGTTATFYAVDEENKITAIDNEKPVIAYYNVTSVAAADGTATFAIPASQTEGAASNKVPLYAYTATPSLAGSSLSLSFNPMASVLEFRISAAPASALDGFSYNLDKVVLTPKTGASGYTVMTAGTIDPSTGTITPSGESLGAITLSFASQTDITTEKHFQMVVGACRMNNTGATMDWYKYKDESWIQNYTKSIWASKDIDLTSTRTHVYQPIAQKVVGLKDYNDWWTKFYQNRNSQSNFISYCDDERTIILTGDIIMTGGSGNRTTCFHGLTWNFDGKGHYIYNFNVTDAQNRIAGFFSNVQADIKNVIFGKAGTNAIINITDNNAGGSYGPIVNLISGTIENITSNIVWTVTVNATESNCYLGGIVGSMSGGSVKGCHVNGSLALQTGDGVSTSKTLAVAGIVGTTSGTASVTGNENNAPISLTASSTSEMHCAGIAGPLYSTVNIQNCDNNASISGQNTYSSDQSDAGKLDAAGIVSFTKNDQSITIRNCTNSGAVTGTSVNQLKAVNAAGIVSELGPGNTVGSCTQRAGVTANNKDTHYHACWYIVWANGTVESGSVLKGIKLNGGSSITESNYSNYGSWARKDKPAGTTLTLLEE